jgi:hypothetical protein
MHESTHTPINQATQPSLRCVTTAARPVERAATPLPPLVTQSMHWIDERGSVVRLIASTYEGAASA